MYAPFILDSDDQLQQLAQLQIFLTLVASIGLRMTPPDVTVGAIATVCLYGVPIFAIFMETPLASELRGLYDMLKRCCGKRTAAVARRMSLVGPDAPAETPVYPMSAQIEPADKLTSTIPDVQVVSIEDEAEQHGAKRGDRVLPNPKES